MSMLPFLLFRRRLPKEWCVSREDNPGRSAISRQLDVNWGTYDREVSSK